MIFEKSIIIIVQKTATKRSARDTNTTTYRIIERRQNFDADGDDADDDVPELRRLRSSLS